MPGVIQPNRPPSQLQGMLQLGQAAMAAKGAFGGSGGQQDPTAQTSAGNIGSPSQAAQGQAVPTQSYEMGDYPGSGQNVFQRRMQRSY